MKQNIETLRNDLLQSFEQLKSGKLDNKSAKEITNMAGKIILSSKVELDYIKYMEIDRKIEFLEVDKEKSNE